MRRHGSATRARLPIKGKTIRVYNRRHAEDDMARPALQWGTVVVAAGLVALSGSRTPADDVTIEVPTIRAADGGVSHGVL
jgi:hypothetical protein